MKNHFLIFGIISIFLVSACSQDTEQTPEQPKIIISEEKATGEALQQTETPEEKTPTQAKTLVPEKTASAEEKTAAPALSVKEFDITAKQFEFIPSTIAVKKGDKVRLNVKSIDVAHGFSIPEFKVEESIKPGTTKTIEFVADKAGEFTFFCSVYCGTGHSGMKGKLIVE